MTTNAEFATSFADLLDEFVAGNLTESEFGAQYKTALDAWSGAELTKGAVTRQIAQTLEYIGLREQEIITWFGGAMNGGWDVTGTTPGGGHYPITLPDGTVVYRPSFAKILSDTQKGDPAKNDAVLNWTFTFGAGEFLGMLPVSEDTVYSAAASRIYCRQAPTSNATFTILKDGSPWGTATILAGQTTGTVTIASPAQDVGELLEFFAPVAHDPTLSDVSLILAGAY